MADYMELLTPQNSQLIIIDQQPQMAFGVQSIDRQTLKNNVVALAKAAAKLELFVAEFRAQTDRVLRLPVSGLENARTLLFDVVTPLRQRQPQFFGLTPRVFLALAGLRRRLALVPDLPEKRFQLEVLGRKLCPGAPQHLLFHPQPSRDGDRVGLARQPDRQVVGGAERLDVEFDRSVAQPRIAVGERLQLPVMGGRDQRAAPLQQRLEHGPGEGCTLRRIGARAQFVEQDERVILERERLEHVASASGPRRPAARHVPG